MSNAFTVHLQLAVMTDITVRASDPDAAKAIAISLCAHQLHQMHRAGFYIRHHNIHTSNIEESNHE